MWTTLAAGAFFSRTLDEQGPMGRLDETSTWRPFLLPFSNREGASPPITLVFHVVMAGAGTVEISPLELVQFQPGEEPMATPGGWWSGRHAGLARGIIGSLLGVMGAVVGWLGSTGRAKWLVLGTLKTISARGFRCAIVIPNSPGSAAMSSSLSVPAVDDATRSAIVRAAVTSGGCLDAN